MESFSKAFFSGCLGVGLSRSSIAHIDLQPHALTHTHKNAHLHTSTFTNIRTHIHTYLNTPKYTYTHKQNSPVATLAIVCQVVVGVPLKLTEQTSA